MSHPILHREVRRATRRVSAEWLTSRADLPVDAQIIGTDYNGRTNTVEIHYTSLEAPVAAEACISAWDDR